MESNISKNSFLSNFRMAPLPALCSKFVELVGILVSESHTSAIIVIDLRLFVVDTFYAREGAAKYRSVWDPKPGWLPLSVGIHVVNPFKGLLSWVKCHFITN